MKIKSFFTRLFKKPLPETVQLSGTFLYYDIENGNGRIYTKECATDIIDQFHKMTQAHFVFPDGTKAIGPWDIYGEFGFPERFETNLGNVSHVVEEIHLNPEKKSIEGTIRILNTPRGELVKDQIRSFGIENFNKHFAVRSRGSGTINENKEVENFKLYSFDIIPKEQDSFKNIE